MPSFEERLIDRLGLNALDRRVAGWMQRNGLFVLRMGLGIVFVWFGLLKPLGMSPAEGLVRRVVYVVPPDLFVPLLGWWEVAIGLCLLVRPLNRLAILLLLVRLPGTLLALVLKFDVCFESGVLTPTIQGQYLIKDATLFFAAMVIGATVREEKRPGHYH